MHVVPFLKGVVGEFPLQPDKRIWGRKVNRLSCRVLGRPQIERQVLRLQQETAVDGQAWSDGVRSQFFLS